MIYLSIYLSDATVLCVLQWGFILISVLLKEKKSLIETNSI